MNGVHPGIDTPPHPREGIDRGRIGVWPAIEGPQQGFHRAIRIAGISTQNDGVIHDRRNVLVAQRDGRSPRNDGDDKTIRARADRVVIKRPNPYPIPSGIRIGPPDRKSQLAGGGIIRDPSLDRPYQETH